MLSSATCQQGCGHKVNLKTTAKLGHSFHRISFGLEACPPHSSRACRMESDAGLCHPQVNPVRHLDICHRIYGQFVRSQHLSVNPFRNTSNQPPTNHISHLPFASPPCTSSGKRVFFRGSSNSSPQAFVEVQKLSKPRASAVTKSLIRQWRRKSRPGPLGKILMLIPGNNEIRFDNVRNELHVS